MADFLSIMDWDWNYSYAFVSFIIGTLAGFQAIYERHGEESGTSVATLPGVGYLFSRGFVPALFFVVLYRSHQVRSYLFGLAIGLGVGTEAVLRSQIQVKTKPVKGSSLATENSFIGLFNILEWYQKFILEQITTRIAAKRQRMVQAAVKRIPTNMSFQALSKQVDTNSYALDGEKEKQAVKAALSTQVAEYLEEVQKAGGTDAAIEDRYKLKLGYWIYRNTHGRHGLKVLYKF